MERIKDFFYNKSDILAALAIILLAGLLIFSRMNVIMDYPAILAAEQAEQQNNPGPSTGPVNSDQGGSQVDPNGSGDGEGQTGDGEGQAGDGEGQTGDGEGQTGNGEGQTGDGGQTGDSGNQGSTGPANGTSVKFTVKGNSTWKSVSEDLQKAGLVTSADDFYKVALKMDTKGDLKTLYPGDYFIVAGSSAEAIISTLTTH